MKKRFFLVDVSSLFFRAFFAIRQLRSASGLPTNAIYGFLSMILKLLREKKPDMIAFCYDQKDPGFRHEIYSDYKANREEAPEDLVPQFPYIQKIADILGIQGLEKKGFEADDVIGTLTKWAQSKNHEVFIVSGDKDFGQLIGPGVYLYDTMKDIQLNQEGVHEKWGIWPEQVIDYLALVGDSSDNVPGVKGVGPKTAEKLLAEYKTLDGIYQNLDQISSESLRQKLIDNKDMAYLSQKLVTIECHVPLPLENAEFHQQPVKIDELKTLIDELSFKNWDKNIEFLSSLHPKENGANATAVERAVERVADLTSSAPNDSKTHSMTSSKVHSELTEITPDEFQSRTEVGQQIWGFQTATGFCLAFSKENADNSEESLQVYELRGDLGDWSIVFSKNEIRWKGFHLKKLWHELKIKNPQLSWDSYLAAYLLKPGESLELVDVCRRYLGKSLPELVDGVQLAQVHLELESKLKGLIKSGAHGQRMQEVLEKMEFPLEPILYQMEVRGICLDAQLLGQQSKELAQEIQQVEKQVFQITGESFNIGSPKQLSVILFQKLQLTPGKKTKTGYSTDSEVLEKLRNEHPIIPLLLDYRELTKLKSTYVDSLPSLIGTDGRIHTTFNQALTTTGRLSSQDPNLQNIPIKTERGARIRKAFHAEKGLLLLSADYSQIELRILAHYSDDKNLKSAFVNEVDVHALTASEVFQVKVAEVTADQRRTAKAINFGIAYGQGAFGLAENLGISRREAQDIIDRYFQRFPGVREYIHETTEAAKTAGFVETLLGRRRYIDELKSANPTMRKFGERAAINAPIQGTASDIVKKAMVSLPKHVAEKMLLQVHDELIFEGNRDFFEKETKSIVSIMETVVTLNVPLRVNAQLGHNWDEAH